MTKADADGYLLSDLADIAWFLNIRGRDISMNPYVYVLCCHDICSISWVFITKEKIHFFIKTSRVTESLKEHLQSVPIEYHDYYDIYGFVCSDAVEVIAGLDEGLCPVQSSEFDHL